jgi:hypothetical protein
VSFTDFDVNDFIGHEQRQATNIAVQSLEDDPDQAARAIQLADATGTPAPIIHGDLENFEREQKAYVATSLVDDNKFIQNYINGHPMAAKVSNDDYGQLDELSAAVEKHNKESILVNALKGFGEHFGEGGLGSWIPQADKDAHPLAAAAWSVLGSPIEGVFRMGSGAIGAVARGAQAAAVKAGIDPDTAKTQADYFIHAAGDPGLWASMGPQLEALGTPFIMAAHNSALREAAKIEPWAKRGEVPPPGVSTVSDAIHAEDAKADKDSLNEMLKATTATATRERSPQMIENFISGITEGEIGINADAVRKLYGEKPPVPGEGPLGFVPDLAAQLQRAEATGGDIKVGLAKYLAEVEPETHKELQDHIRARPEGMTVEEGKGVEPTEAHSTEPVEVIRQAAGLKSAEGSKFSLVEGEPIGDAHIYAIHDPEGKDIGHLNIAEENGGKRLYVDDTKVEGGAGALGTRAIRDAAKQLFDQFPNAEEIVGEHVSGAKEKVGVPSNWLAIKRPKPPKQLELPIEGTTRMEDRDAFASAPPGFTIDMYRRWQKAIDKQREDDAAAIKDWATKDARVKETAVWKENRAAMRPEVAGEFSKQPEFVLDEMLRSQGIRIDASKLSPEQIKALPAKWLAAMRRPGRVDPEVLARNLGAESGDALINRLIALHQTRETAGMKPREFMQRAIDIETDARMEKQFGDLDKNVLERAYERVLSETQEDILHEETLRHATLAGEAFPIKKQPLIDQMKAEMGSQKMGEVSAKEKLAEAGRAGRAAEKAELAGDYAEGFRQAQRRENAFLQAREAARLEKERGRFEDTADKFLKREGGPTTPEYRNAIQAILEKLGYAIKRSPEDLVKETEASGYTGLADFIAQKENQHKIEGLEFDVPDFLLDDKFKSTVDELTAAEFRAVKAGVDNLIHVGREEKKVLIGGEKADLRQTIKDMGDQLKAKWPAQTISVKQESAKKQLAKSALAASTNLETLFQRFDGRDLNGLFTRTFVYPGAEAANYKARLEREYAAKYKALGEIPNKGKVLSDVPLLDPATGERIKDFTRENLAAVISNMGNEYNWNVFAKGWKIDPAVLKQWVINNSTRADFDRAFELSKIFADGKKMSDVVYRNIKGVAPEDIPVTPFTAHGKEYPGWYHPIIKNDKLSNAILDKDPLDKPINFWPTTPNGYTKRRSGAIDVLSTDYALVPAKLNQILHDVAFREFITNASKITRDKEFRSNVSRAYGKEYVEEINQWIERVAGNASYNSEAMTRAVRASNFIRQNVISTHIAFNLGTIEKHATTAAVMSAKELGPNTFTGALKLGKITAEVALDSFRHAVGDLFGKSEYLGESISQFIDRNSEEIQRRERHFQDTVGSTHEALTQGATLRDKVAYWGAKGVAISDKISAKPLWLGKYREVMGETGDHGLAVSQANLSVRRAHGSTAITSLPRVAASGGLMEPWVTSLYGFMGANMQRRIEIAHDVSDAWKLAKGKELGAAAKALPKILDSVMSNVIWVGIVEETVASQFTDDRRTGLQHALSAVSTTLAQTIIGLRDMSYSLSHGRAPQVGLLSGALEEVTAPFRDLTKPNPLSAANAGKLVADTITTLGDLKGIGPKPIARAAGYGIDVFNQKQNPQGAGDVWRGVMSGQQKLRLEK